MAEKDQSADIDNRRRESKAEAFSFTFASVMVSGLPVVLVALTIVLALLGEDMAAVVSGLFTVVTAGPQIIAAIRSPKRKESD